MFPWLRAIVAAGSFAIVAAGLVASPASAEGAAQRYLVQYAPGTDIAAAARTLRTQGIDVGRTFGHAVKAAVVTTTEARAEALEDLPRVESVEVDALLSVGDTQQSAPWGLDRLDQRALPLTSTFTSSAAGLGVDAYVLDTGVDANHVDLAGRVVAGWTAINDGAGAGECAVNPSGHGTHVAGTVAGSTYGVAKAATVVPVRVLDCNGSGYMSWVVAGLDWMVARHVAGTPAVANLSLGGGTSATVDAAIDRAVADGVTIAVSAGNDAADACTASPARAASALTVAASDKYDRQASFSNIGPCVDLYAPGVQITSAAAGTNTGTSTKSGTSMASPHVAGAAAVLLSREPALTPAQVAARLTAEATSGVVTGATAGTPNRLLYLDPGATAPPAPPAPTQPEPAPTQPSPEVQPPPAQPQPVATAPQPASSLEAVARQRAARLSWVRGGDGGSPLTGQTVRVYRGTTRVGSFTVPATVTAVRIIGLRPGRTYRFTVVETNRAGNSPESARSEKVRPRR